jgi:hypothetical protein
MSDSEGANPSPEKLIKCYRHARQELYLAQAEHFEKLEILTTLKQNVQDATYAIYMRVQNANKLGANEKEREARIATELAPLIAELRAAEKDAERAGFEVRDKTQRVEDLRFYLRCLEEVSARKRL